MKNVKKYRFHILTFAIEWRKLYLMTLTYILDFKCLKYVKSVRFRVLPESENNDKISAINIQTFAIERLSNVFSVTLTYFSKVISLKY